MPTGHTYRSVAAIRPSTRTRREQVWVPPLLRDCGAHAADRNGPAAAAASQRQVLYRGTAPILQRYTLRSLIRGSLAFTRLPFPCRLPGQRGPDGQLSLVTVSTDCHVPLWSYCQYLWIKIF
jgi:hypothetical protein